jgi:glycerophosphoryl diester phosphodiesterase
MRTPQIVAHRGFSGRYPENTRVAIEGAIALGVDMVEVDVRLSRDHVPVIFHDARLRHITTCPHRVDALTAGELKTLDIGRWRGNQFRNERILTLTETLDLVCNRIPINLDIKTPAAIAPVVATVQERKMVDNVVVSGCSWKQAHCIRRLEPHLHILMNVDDLLTTLLRLCSARLALLISHLQVRIAQVTGLNVGHHIAADHFIRNATARNLPVWTWTVDDPTRALHLAKLGAISITSNWPDRLLDRLLAVRQ